MYSCPSCNDFNLNFQFLKGRSLDFTFFCKDDDGEKSFRPKKDWNRNGKRSDK